MIRIRPEKVYVALLTLSLLFPFSTGQASSQTLEGDEIHDLPAMAVNVGDLSELGYEGFVTKTSGLLTADSFLNQQIELYPDQADDFETYIDDGDLVARYDLYAEIEDENLDPITRVQTYITQFEDGSGARDWFEFIDGDDKDIETDMELGRLSELSTLTEEGTHQGTSSNELDYTFVLDSYVAGIKITEFAYDDDPRDADQDMVEELAELLAEKIEAVLEDGGLGLGNRIVRFENAMTFIDWSGGDELIIDNDVYTTIDFQYLPMYVDRPEDAEAYSADNKDRGIETEYSYQPGVFIAGLEEWQAVAVWVRIWTDEEAAEAYVADPESAQYDGVEQDELTDVGAWGDQSHVYTNEYEIEGESYTRYEVLVQYGDITFWVKFGDMTGAGFEPIAAYLDATEECMQETSCDDEVPYPF